MQLKETALPKTMRAAQAKDYGDYDDVLSVEDDVPYPSLADLPARRRKKSMIIRTHAVALACGDCRVMSGLTRELQGPPSMPYIPGGDCSGVVVEIPEDATDCPFQVGDRVAARFVVGPRDALAEYALVHQAVCEKVPEEIPLDQAAALAGACPATLLGERIQSGERVLVLGAGGGVGSLACQVMRHRGASFIAGTSQQSLDRLLSAPMSYDKIVNYNMEDPFAVKEFQENPFDVVVDLAGVGGWLSILKASKNGDKPIVKSAANGGRYLTLTPDTAIFELHTVPQALKVFLFIPLWRALKSRLWGRSKLPKYTYAMSLDAERTHLTRTLEMARQGTIKAVIDQRGPFPFTTEGVRSAFRVQETRHAEGKVVIQVADS